MRTVCIIEISSEIFPQTWAAELYIFLVQTLQHHMQG